MGLWLSFTVTDDYSDSESEAEERFRGIAYVLTRFFSLEIFYTASLTGLSFVAARSLPRHLNKAKVNYNCTKTRNVPVKKDLHQRKLFEYFLVVSLQKSKAGGRYLPEVTQQFPPKVSNLQKNLENKITSKLGF